MLTVIFFSRISPKLLVSLLPAIILVLFPVIINGKEIIYQVVVNGDYSYILEFYNIGSPDKDAVFLNLAHPFVSTVFSDDVLDMTGYRFFYDYIQGVLFYFRILGLDFGDSLTYYNTASILGIHESVVPPGYVAFGYIQLGYIGVLFSGLFYRMTFKIFSKSYMYRLATGKEMVFYASFISANTFYTGDIRQLVISFFLVVLIMHIVGMLAIKRVHLR
jgi:hypothetical protein